MSLQDIVDRLARRPSVTNPVVALPGPAGNTPAPEEGYFQVRLAQMHLSDERRWHQEITPVAFIIGEFAYNGARVRKPCFVSNEMIGPLVAGIDQRKLRVNFARTLVIGPTPYTGGDVELFVGLFQAVTDDRLSAMFGMFEKLFSCIPVASAVATGFAMASEMLPAVLKCLGSSDITCLLADRQPIGAGQTPANAYLAYLRGNAGRPAKSDGLQVKNGVLYRDDDGVVAPVEDADFCLVEVECMALRSDWQTLPFHTMWGKAMELTATGKTAEAQAAMMECARQITVSPDLTETHKIALIRSYQASLIKRASDLQALFADTATRSGTALNAADMRTRLRDARDFDSDQLAATLDGITRLANRMGTGTVEQQLEDQMRIQPKATAKQTQELLRTLTLASIAA